MGYKSFLVAATIVFISFTTLITCLITSYEALQTLNPIAALTAITVAIIGILWFRKTSG